MEQEILTIAVEWQNDNWYGKNYRLIFAGYDNKGFATKTEAKKHTSMLKIRKRTI